MVRKSSSMESFIKEDTKTIALVSNNYWTLYKFRYDVVQMFIKKEYKVILIAGKDSFHTNFKNNNITKIFLPIDERGMNPFSEIKTILSLYRIYKHIKTDLVMHFTIKPNIYGSLMSKILDIKSISFITGIGHIFLKKKSLIKVFSKKSCFLLDVLNFMKFPLFFKQLF